MALKSDKRKRSAAMKLAKKKAMLDAGGQSRYARKVAYLKRFGGSGDSYPEPKPWK